MSCFNRQGEVKADDAKYTGTEPTWDDADKLTEYQLTERMAKGLAFYSYYCTKKDLLNDLIVFMNDENKYTKKQINEIKRHYEKIYLFTVMKVARMFNRGCPKSIDNGTTYSYINVEIENALKQTAKFVYNKELENQDKPKVPQISPVVRLINKINREVIAYC